MDAISILTSIGGIVRNGSPGEAHPISEARRRIAAALRARWAKVRAGKKAA